MVTLLFIIISISFIGLGIPDSVFGAAWPEIQLGFGFPSSYANYVTLTNFSFTVISSLLSNAMVKKFGTGVVTAFSTLLTALGLLGFSLSKSYIIFVLMGIPLGFGAGGIDAVLNNYVATYYKGSHMSFLHCFYGVGVFTSPFVMSFALSGVNGWRGGYTLMFIIQMVITSITFLALPLWFKVKKNGLHKPFALPKEEKKEKGGLLAAAKNPLVRVGWLIFFGSVALEFTCGVWSSSYFVHHHGLSPDRAAFILSFYYAGITIGRFISGLLNTKMKPWTIISVGQVITLLGVVLIFFGGEFLPILAVILIGLGNGPLFPNMTYLTPYNFGKENTQAIIGTQMAVCNISIALMTFVFGYIADVAIWIFPIFLLIEYAIMILGTIILRTKLKRKITTN